MLEEFRAYLEIHLMELFQEARQLPSGSLIYNHLNDHASYIIKFWLLVLPAGGGHLSIENEVIPAGIDLERLKILCQVIDWKFNGGSSGRSIINFEYDDAVGQGRIAFTP